MATTRYRHLETPLGRVLLTGREGALTGLHFTGLNATPAIDRAWVADDSGFEAVCRQLDEYFAGRRQSFDVPLQMDGSPFQVEVWSALLGVQYGETASYGEIARRIGRKGAARAVGAANGRNPIAIIVPCHRVIGADDTLTGYGGGLDRKAWLLDLERGFRYQPEIGLERAAVHTFSAMRARHAGMRARAVLRPSPATAP
jgi:methylated-DNA-[protein]-cysteine S-methyltransferase